MTIRVKSTTEVHDPSGGTGIQVYPNPSRGNFQIKIYDGYSSFSYEIYDIKGTLIENRRIDCQAGECTFDITMKDPSPEVYNLIIKKNGLLFGQKKLIISE